MFCFGLKTDFLKNLFYRLEPFPFQDYLFNRGPVREVDNLHEQDFLKLLHYKVIIRNCAGLTELNR